jgi:hypothetical protein
VQAFAKKHSLANIWSLLCCCFTCFLLLASCVHFLVICFLLLFSCSGFAGGNSVGFSASAQRGALGVSHKRSSIRFCGDLLGVLGLACVCVAFEQRRVEFFQPHWKPDWFATASGFRRSLSTNLFLCVWREGRRVDGWRSLIFSTGLYRACYIE